MKLVFILVLTAFTVCLSREIHRHRHEKKFPQERETIQKDAYIGPKPGVSSVASRHLHVLNPIGSHRETLC